MPESGWPIPRLWEGQRGVIVAGGPSVSTKQLRLVVKARLQDRIRVLVINDAGYLLHGTADWLHAADQRWWNGNKELFKFPGIKTTCHPPQHGTIRRLGYRRGVPLETEPEWIATGINSGFAGINILFHTGVKEIGLVGFDMKPNQSGESHWFGDHEFAATQPEVYEGWRRAYKTLPASLEPFGVKVVNLTPGSTLDMFERGELNKWL